MNKIATKAILLSRLNYKEADRIITVLTPNYGKLSLIAKGVRKSNSKLAGGIELFCVSDITFVKGKSNLSVLTSSRLDTYYSKIITDINRTTVGYEILNIINKNSHDDCPEEYFELLNKTIESLNNLEINIEVTKSWFLARLLHVLGNNPNLENIKKDEKLKENNNFNFNYDSMSFMPVENGVYFKNHIKVFRLLYVRSPKLINSINNASYYCKDLNILLEKILQNY
jgi:DNA repair protein RecO (recombination protein O)